jgi:hypothetical protein
MRAHTYVLLAILCAGIAPAATASLQLPTPPAPPAPPGLPAPPPLPAPPVPRVEVRHTATYHHHHRHHHHHHYHHHG